jgi:hypothetical protein
MHDLLWRGISWRVRALEVAIRGNKAPPEKWLGIAYFFEHIVYIIRTRPHRTAFL